MLLKIILGLDWFVDFENGFIILNSFNEILDYQILVCFMEKRQRSGGYLGIVLWKRDHGK